jgi:hypothetical protein
MKLSLACRQLQDAVLHSVALRSRTYRYEPDRLDVAALRTLDRRHVQDTLAQAEARGDTALLDEQTYPLPDTRLFSLRQWFRAVGAALVASLHLAR